MKIEHIESELANSIRAVQLSGTTDSGSKKHKVFHIDEDRGYALMYYPGSTYYVRGPQYCPGHVSLIWIGKQASCHRHLNSRDVMNTARDKGGRLTQTKVDALVETINREVEQLVDHDTFASLAEGPLRGAKLEVRIQDMVGRVLVEPETGVMVRLDCVAYTSCVGKVGEEYYATCQEHEEFLKEKRQAKAIDKAADQIREWMAKYGEADTETRVEMLAELMGVEIDQSALFRRIANYESVSEGSV